MAYLRDKCGDDLNAVLQQIENRFLTLPLQELLQIGGQDNPCNIKAERKAQRFLEEYKLAECIRSQNSQKGVALGFRHMASRNRSLHALGLPEHPKALARTGRHDRQWVRRWTQRWKGARRKIPVHEAENPDELTKKATRRFTFF